jgi:4-amino-4-deoxy-L-arabinose transferase-like glycosyltransferase
LNFKKQIWLLIGFSTLLRMMVSGLLELGNDEAYYQGYALHLQWNYFDHPPMLALLIRMGTFNGFFHHEFFIRLGSILCAGISTYIIYRIGCRIRNESAGWIAALLYTTSFYTSIIAGTFILPDSPLVLFWVISMYLMIRIVQTPAHSKISPWFFILSGISTGLCIMSKVHGVFLWLGLLGFIIFHRRDLLKNPFLYLGLVISLIIISPIYFWNVQNHFITYTYQNNRVILWGKVPDADRFLQQVLGSVFYCNPVNFVIYIISLLAILKRKVRSLPGYFPLLLWLSLPLILLLLWMSLFNDTLPHWSGPAYISLMLISALYLEQQYQNGVFSKAIKIAAVSFVATVCLGVLAIRDLPFRIGSHKPMQLGKGDITLDMVGWKDFAIKFDSLYRNDKKEGRMKPGAMIISDYWFPAGHLDHYIGQPFHINLRAVGPLNDIHHFAWLNQRRPLLKNGDDAYFIYPSNYYGPPKDSLINCFRAVDDPVIITQFRMSKPVRNFVICRMHGFIASPPGPALP